MKQLKHLVSVLMVLAMVFFVGCSKDDDNKGGGNDGGSGNGGGGNGLVETWYAEEECITEFAKFESNGKAKFGSQNVDYKINGDKLTLSIYGYEFVTYVYKIEGKKLTLIDDDYNDHVETYYKK